MIGKIAKKFSILFILLFSGNLFAGSPYELNEPADYYILGGGIINMAAGFFVHQSGEVLSIDEIERLDPMDLNVLDRSAAYNFSDGISKVSDYALAGFIALPFALFLSDRVNDDFSTVSVMYLETITWNSALAGYTKGFVERTRPFVYHPDAPLDLKQQMNSRRSFFSGHTSSVFASAVFTSMIYDSYYPDSDWSPLIWGGSLLSASAIGYMRYESGRHFPTDIFVGAAVGSLIGYLIPKLHESDDGDNINENPPGTHLPSIGFGYSFNL